ncbi:MAG: ABC transporter substrate-binding protein, partial [Chloroflexota bacterium]|nr:ABC transporter substrate-binding protein [Chloroflexota bacterium]
MDEHQHEHAKRLSRRHFLSGAAIAAGTAILAACGGSSSATDTAKPATTSGAAPAASAAAPAAPASTTAASGSVVAGAATKPAGSAAAAPATGGGTVLSQIDVSGAKKGGSIIEGSTTDVRTLNPLLQSDTSSARINALMFDGLVEINPDTLQASPNLATKWETSSDGKTYTFTVKQGVKWHDGQPFSADDVKFSYDLYMNKDTGTARAGQLLERIASVEAKDATTVVFNMKDIVAPFLVSNCSYGILPKHILSSVAPKDIPTSEFTTTKPIGTGPFTLKEFKQGDHVTLSAYPAYHRGAPFIDTYIRKFVKDSTALYQQLKTGEVDFAAFTADFVEDAKKQTNFATTTYDAFSFNFFGYNLDTTGKGLPMFQDIKVRQALFYAIDRKGIVDKIRNGLATVAQGTMPTISWAYAPDKITTRYDFDPKKAAQMLDDAGWKKGSDGIRAKDGKKLSFSMNFNSGDKIIEGYASVFQENWKDIGVEMKPIFEEFSQFVTRLTKTFDFETFFVGFSWGVDPDQQTMWDSKQHGPGFNLYSYKNDKVDQ